MLPPPPFQLPSSSMSRNQFSPDPPPPIQQRRWIHGGMDNLAEAVRGDDSKLAGEGIDETVRRIGGVHIIFKRRRRLAFSLALVLPLALEGEVSKNDVLGRIDGADTDGGLGVAEEALKRCEGT
ncbi:hypothetical protein LINPERPRIM_LOCUS17413 [Linum perenne]